jgi:hypothetical protein
MYMYYMYILCHILYTFDRVYIAIGESSPAGPALFAQPREAPYGALGNLLCLQLLVWSTSLSGATGAPHRRKQSCSVYATAYRTFLAPGLQNLINILIPSYSRYTHAQILLEEG